MPVAGSVGQAVNVGQALGVAEIAGLANGKVQGNRGINVPIGGDLKASAKNKIRVGFTPIGAPRDWLPVGIVYFWGNRGINQGTFQLEVPERRQWLTAVVNQRLDQPQASVDFAGGQANVMKHGISALILANFEQHCI